MVKKIKFPFKFSIVMPVYNVERYLESSINNVIKQDIGFNDNIQLILVNDGSLDESYKICEKYKKIYPENITYLKQRNKGVSSARNLGLKEVRGKYVSFLDSDDKLSTDCLRLVYDFFEINYDKIDLVSVKQLFFDSRIGEHPLNYKYDKDRVIDINLEYDKPQLSLTSAFVKGEAVVDYGIKFDTKLKYAEDAKFATDLIMNKMAYGVLSGPAHFYRKRSSVDSAIDKARNDYSWYFDTPRLCYKYLLDKYSDENKYASKYVQYLIIYDLQYRIKQKSQGIFDDIELKKYKDLIFNVTKKINDEIIVCHDNISTDVKIYLLSKKHGKNIEKDLYTKGAAYYYKDFELYNYKKWGACVNIQRIELSNNSLKIDGFINKYIAKDMSVGFIVNGRLHRANRTSLPTRYTRFFDDIIYEGYTFNLSVPITCDQLKLQPVYYIDTSDLNIESIESDSTTIGINNPSGLLAMKGCRYSYLMDKRFSYHIFGNYVAKINNKGVLMFNKADFLRIFMNEILRSVYIIKSIGLRYSLENIITEIKTVKFIEQLDDSYKNKLIRLLKYSIRPLYRFLKNLLIVIFRVLYYLLKLSKRKQIWLFSDRTVAAGDNGEALYKYVLGQKNTQIKSYFFITKNSGDYERIKKYGKVIAYGSLRYKLLFLLADKVVSSHIDDFIVNAFAGDLIDMGDIYYYKFVFLQHGIIKDDLSSWLNKYNKDIKIFVTSAKPEYDSIIKGDYYFDESVVKLTGLPRYDLLDNKSKNKLILTPTWRHYLANKADKSGKREYFDDFKESDYYKFYNSLMNDVRLLDVLKEYNMTGEFYIHPSISTQASDFKGNKIFNVKEMPYDYKTAFSEGSAMVTDYSSVAFDFAYLKKPVIYSQFDKNEFFANHLYTEGYFSYDKNGFGPVAYDYESTVREIIKQIKSGCRMQQKYIKRVEGFFAYTDKNNCKRVYEEIIKMESI